MKKVCGPAGAGGAYYYVCLMVVIAAAALATKVEIAEGVTCSAVELSPCLGAITSSAAPSGECCRKLREQRPCLCGYIRNPNLSQYVNSPGARRVAAACGVPSPSC